MRLADAIQGEKRLIAAPSRDPEWLERWRTARNRVLRAAEDYAAALKVFREVSVLEVALDEPRSSFRTTIDAEFPKTVWH